MGNSMILDAEGARQRNGWLGKILVLLFIVIISPFLGAVYGLLHNQFTYTISPQFFMEELYYRFEMGVENGDLTNYGRFHAGVIGIVTTWWMGLLIGIVLGLAGLVHINWKQMLAATAKAIGLTILVCAFVGIVGLAFGKWILAWGEPDATESNMIAVGTMHSASYLGGIVGLLYGVYYTLKERRRYSD